MNDHPATSHPTTHHISGAWADRLAGTVYVCVAAVALVGQSTAAVHWLGWPLLPSVAAVAILEVAAVAVAARADYRRRLGESAVVARLLATGIAAFMCVVNFVGHWMVGQTVAAWFFAMTTLVGYLIWLLHSAARRRDALREAGKLGVTSPEYGTWSWLVRPRVTARARWLALRDPGLGLHGSLDLAAEQLRREQRDRLLARQLRRRLRQHTDRTTARMAALTYDLDAIARGLADQANYGRLAALVGADLDPDRLLAAGPASSQVVDGQVVAEWAEREAEASTGQPSSGQPAEPATGQDTPVATGQPATGQPATDDHRPAGHVNGHHTNGHHLADHPKITPLQPTTRPASSKPTIAELADHLCTVHCTNGPNLVGAPTAATTLRARFGSCSIGRVREAKDLHIQRHADSQEP